jgi:hypothetical protein
MKDTSDKDKNTEEQKLNTKTTDDDIRADILRVCGTGGHDSPACAVSKEYLAKVRKVLTSSLQDKREDIPRHENLGHPFHRNGTQSLCVEEFDRPAEDHVD